MNGVLTASGKTIDPFGSSLFDSASARALSRVGVVDVGSNSVRLVVFDGAARSPAYFYNEKIMCGLGQGTGLVVEGCVGFFFVAGELLVLGPQLSHKGLDQLLGRREAGHVLRFGCFGLSLGTLLACAFIDLHRPIAHRRLGTKAQPLKSVFKRGGEQGLPAQVVRQVGGQAL